MKRIDRYDQHGNYKGTNYEYHEHEQRGYSSAPDTPPAPLGLFGRTVLALIGLALVGGAIIFVSAMIEFESSQNADYDFPAFYVRLIADAVFVLILGYLAYRSLRAAFSKDSTE